MFRTILVLDIFDGVVVHALRGKREEYLPVADFSSVCETSDAAGIWGQLSGHKGRLWILQDDTQLRRQVSRRRGARAYNR